jgi:hypothetical protein
MSNPSPSFGRQLLYTVTILLSLIVIATIIGEAVVRVKFADIYTKPPLVPPYDTAEKDDYFGWVMRPNYTWTGDMKDANHEPYPVSIHYDENGFKAFGDPASTKPKLLFLGDSYTASIEASNERTFYNIIADSLGVEVFAYGHAGYGTLQEYLMLDKWVDKIKPDLVVWETCSNDFIDNYPQLEIACGYKVGQRRPYLDRDGTIFYRRPLNLWQRLKEPIWFYRWLNDRWDMVKFNATKQEKKSGEYYIANEKREYRPFNEAVKRTEKIVSMIRKRLPKGTKLIAFSADTYEPQVGEMKRIFEENGFPFLEDPAQGLEAMEVEQKIALKAVDHYHWNEKGQAVIAAGLLPHLKETLGVNPQIPSDSTALNPRTVIPEGNKTQSSQ